jgi:DNA-binding NarL/FixJ family response regulator
LIVDDNAPLRRSLRACIEQDIGFRVCGEAENGRIAVEKVKELRPDVVVMDLQMPVMNGLEAAQQIKIIAPETTVIMLTMHDSHQLLRDAQAAGIKEVLSKSAGEIAHRLLPSLRNLL